MSSSTVAVTNAKEYAELILKNFIQNDKAARVYVRVTKGKDRKPIPESTMGAINSLCSYSSYHGKTILEYNIFLATNLFTVPTIFEHEDKFSDNFRLQFGKTCRDSCREYDQVHFITYIFENMFFNQHVMSFFEFFFDDEIFNVQSFIDSMQETESNIAKYNLGFMAYTFPKTWHSARSIIGKRRMYLVEASLCVVNIMLPKDNIFIDKFLNTYMYYTMNPRDYVDFFVRHLPKPGDDPKIHMDYDRAIGYVIKELQDMPECYMSVQNNEIDRLFCLRLRMWEGVE